jgi:hypothetical protein
LWSLVWVVPASTARHALLVDDKAHECSCLAIDLPLCASQVPPFPRLTRAVRPGFLAVVVLVRAEAVPNVPGVRQGLELCGGRGALCWSRKRPHRASARECLALAAGLEPASHHRVYRSAARGTALGRGVPMRGIRGEGYSVVRAARGGARFRPGASPRLPRRPYCLPHASITPVYTSIVTRLFYWINSDDRRRSPSWHSDRLW